MARLWDAGNGRPIGQAMVHGGKVLGAVFDPDENFVVTWSADRVVRIDHRRPHGSLVRGRMDHLTEQGVIDLIDATTAQGVDPGFLFIDSVIARATSRISSRCPHPTSSPRSISASRLRGMVESMHM